MAVVRLKLLGGFEARLASGEQAQIPIRKGQALLAYLALMPDLSAPRTVLASLFWGDHGETQAQTSLRQTLTVLRKALAPIQEQVLRTDRQSVALNPDALEVDAMRFRALAASDAPEDLQDAVTLFSGDLLHGIDIPDPEFEAWLENERRQFRELMAGRLAALIAHKRAEGDTAEALALAQRWLSMDSLQERVHRLLMELYAEHGQREAALQQFQRCRDLLESELGVEPEAETEALYQALCDNGFGAREQGDFAPGVPPPQAPDEIPAGEPIDGAAPSDLSRLRSWRGPAVGGFALIALVASAGLLWLKPWVPNVEPASLSRMAYPLPDRPSIAVLPFDNMSDDPTQDIFADGITDGLITELSKISGLFVIARNSTSVYKGKAVPIGQVAEDLGVRYVIEGSVRQSGERIRVNVQLIDATTGGHVWAERYESSAPLLFDVEDQVLEKIISALSVELSDYERIRLDRIPTNNLEAYDYYMRAEQGAYSLDFFELGDSIAHYEKAISLDERFAEAYAGLARVLVDILRQDFGALSPSPVAKARAYEAATRAIRLQPGLSRPFSVLGILQMIDGEHDEAIASARRAVALAPNDAEAHINLALVLAYAGHPSKAVEAADMAFRLNPKAPPGFHIIAGVANFLDGRYERATAMLEDAFAVMPDNGLVLETLAMCYGQIGRLDNAKAVTERLMQWAPGASLAAIEVLYAQHAKRADLERRLEALRKAGWPEQPFGFEGRSEDRLDNAELRKLIEAGNWSGRFQKAAPFFLGVNGQSSFALRTPEHLFSGELKISDGSLCFKSSAHLLGRWFCASVFRNPQGRREDGNEYHFAGGIWFLEFSAE